MNTSKDNYRVEIKLDPRQSFAEMGHDWFVSAGAELALELEKHLGIKTSRVSLVWDARHECESCAADVEFDTEETECIHCESMMCHLCNCNTHNQPICEECWEGGKR